MEYKTLGATGLKVSVAGLGCGGFSRLGMGSGKSESEAADVVRTALDLGVNYIDTAAVYGTERAVGQAIRGRDRGTIVIATKVRPLDSPGRLLTADEVAASLEESLAALGTDYIDVYQIHALRTQTLEYATNVVLPVIVRAKQQGKIRHIGASETDTDPQHEALLAAAGMDEFEVMLIAFHMLHQTARTQLLPKLRKRHIGAVVMYAVRRLFSEPERLREIFAELAAAGKVPAAMAQLENPLDFLRKSGAAGTTTEAAYRFARHEPGVDVVLFGTGNKAHVREDVAAILKPPLPAEDQEKIRSLFGHLAGVGLDAHALARKVVAAPTAS